MENGGSDSNGGGFNPGNANMATDLVGATATGASPVVTSASYTFVAGDVGAWVFIQSGTNWTPGWYKIASVSGGAATLAAGIGAGVLYLGGNAFTVTTVVGCATTASPTGGVWSIDYSQQTGAGVTYTDMVIDGTTNTKYTSAGFPVGKNIVGNIVNVTSGAGFTVQRVEVVSTSGTTATCDKSLGTLSSTGGHGALGGCFATPGQAGAMQNSVGSQTCFLKYNASAYSATSTANVAGGRWNMGLGSATLPNYLVGYDTHRSLVNTDANRPSIDCASASMQTIVPQAPCVVRNIICTNSAARSGCYGFALAGSHTVMERCKADAMTVDGFNISVTGMLISCEATNGAAGGNGFNCTANSAKFFDCVAKGNSGPGFLMSGATGMVVDCIAAGQLNNTAGFSTTNVGDTLFVNCVAYNGAGGSAAHGFTCGGQNNRFLGCIAYGNAGKGFSDGSSNPAAQLWNCASDTLSANLVASQPGLITLSSDPFTNGGSGDFSLNSTSGGGLELKAAGYPAAFPPSISTNNYRDIGAAQHADPAGGTSGFVVRKSTNAGGAPLPVMQW